MKTFFLLLIIYVLLFIAAFIVYITRTRRDYWFRTLVNVQPSPFRKETYKYIKRIGLRKNKSGIVSYSLYGNYKKYTPQLVKNIDKVKSYLPNWCVRVYTAVDIPKDILKKLKQKGAEIIIMGPKIPIGYEGSLWRFLAAEEDVPFVSLDADDEFTKKIAKDINNWQGSGKQFCLLTVHKFVLPMTAGTWGANPGSIPNIKTLMDNYYQTWFGFDEAFLKKEVWPIAQQKGFWRSSRVIRYDIILAIFAIVLVGLMLWSLYLTYKNEF